MDNPLTPHKIERLMHIAEAQDSSYASQPTTPMTEVESMQWSQVNQQAPYESSSGVLDLDQIEAFGESAQGSDFLRVRNTFSPAEMTGRSTSAEEVVNKTMPIGRHSNYVEAITNQMNKQTAEIGQLLSHSFCDSTAYSFQSKRDLTADEASLVMREAPLPVLTSSIQTHFTAGSINNSVLSVGAYFQKRCSGLEAALGKVPDSPNRSGFSLASITEVTPKTNYTIDESLDCVPVRQSRLDKVPEMLNPNKTRTFEKPTLPTRTKDVNYSKSNDTYSKTVDMNYSSLSKAPEAMFLAPMKPLASSSFASTRQPPMSKPTDVLIRQMNAGLKLTTEDTEESACPTENSISLSKIADYLGKESNISVSAMIKYNNRNKPATKKQPLTELHMNLQEGKESMKVTSLRDSRKTDAGSSAGTLSTVISVDKHKDKVPAIVVTTQDKEHADDGNKDATRSKSPSSKSQSTLSTVHENYASFKSGDSPLQNSKGEGNKAPVLSPNVVYRELDKSVDWHDVLQQKRLIRQSLAKEQWVDIDVEACSGFVGVGCAVNFNITTLTDNWLTACLKFDNLPKDVTIELPRLPLLLSPGRTEKFTFQINSNIELDTSICYRMSLSDASDEGVIEKYGSFDIQIKMPIIQAMSSDGVNKVSFPPIQENSSLTKSFVFISDCAADLQLELSIAEGESIFSIKSIQEINKCDVNKVLMEKQGSIEEMVLGKSKNKGINKQLCRLSSGNAIKVKVKINAPKLSDLHLEGNISTFTGALNVYLIGVDTVIRRVELVGTVGTVTLVANVPGNKLNLTSEPQNITLSNLGSVSGVWVLKIANVSTDNFPFKVGPSKLDIRPGGTKNISLRYTGPEDIYCTAKLVFEDLITCQKTAIEITGGTENKNFPIKTNHGILSFIKPGVREVNLKNITNKKINIRVFVEGDGFSIDLPGLEAKGVYGLTFAPMECRPLPIMFHPNTYMPQCANVHLVYDKNSGLSRTVRLFGCSSGESLRWSGLVTYGETALVRAVSRAPCRLELYNKWPMAAFFCANVQFNLQYIAVAATARLTGNNVIINGRGKHCLTLHVDWARVERRARETATAALATITVLTGAELTRRRILKVIREESSGAPDTSLLDDHLKVLAGQFEGEDPSVDNLIKDFKETKASLNELIGGLHELTAQIVLPQDFMDENTIIISDDTVLEHHTLCD